MDRSPSHQLNMSGSHRGRPANESQAHAPIYVDDEIMDMTSDESEDAEERLDHVHDIQKRNGFERISMLVERSNASNTLA